MEPSTILTGSEQAYLEVLNPIDGVQPEWIDLAPIHRIQLTMISVSSVHRITE